MSLNPMKKTTVSAVMAAFNKTIADLQSIATTQDAEATRQADIIAKAGEARAAAAAEAEHARQIAAKMGALVAAS